MKEILCIVGERVRDFKYFKKGYEITRDGDVFSNSRIDHGGHKLRRKKLKPNYRGNYLSVTLCRDGKTKRFPVHRLVALQFLDNIHNKEQVNHKDGDKINNKLSNLEWSTRSENQKHAYKTGLQKVTCNKKVEQYSKNNDFIKEYESVTEAAISTGISIKYISRVALRKYGRKTAGGFVWRYL